MEAKHLSEVFQLNIKGLGNYYLVTEFDTKAEILDEHEINPDTISYQNVLGSGASGK